MRYVSGDPWDPTEKEAREQAQRPAFASDELSQYINQLVNDPRQNPRAIKINPKGAGASDKTAETRENLIRQIQYNSNAQGAFTTGFQGAVERSYGYWGVGARYKSDAAPIGAFPDKADVSLFEQELYIYRIPNPDSVMHHPDFKEMDASDAMGCFVIDKVRRPDFKRKYPGAAIVDFTEDHLSAATGWIDSQDVKVGSYFKIELESRDLYLIDPPTNRKDRTPIARWADTLAKSFDKKRIVRERTVERREVTQYVTNGVEILDEISIPIPWIPIVPCFGKELWIDYGSGSRRILMSLIRLARDPFMMYCYLVSQEAEEAGMTPRAPVMGAVGQFVTDRVAWENLNRIPRAFIQYDTVTDSSAQMLPPPARVPFSPNFQAYELAIQGARTRIQAAMGITPLPTAAQRATEKSGVALQRIDQMEDRGSFHFIDNYNHSITHTGRILDAWTPIIYDTARDEGVRMADESYKIVRINDPNYTEKDKSGVDVQTHYDLQTGEHGVTVSTGPNYASQRDEANELVELLIQNIQSLPLAPPQAAKLLSLAIRLKQVGPLGDEIADIVSPSDNEQAQQQAMANAQTQMQQSREVIAKLTAELQKLKLEKAGKVIDNEYALQMQRLQNDIKVLVAEIQSKAQDQSQRTEMFMEFWKENHGAAHEQAMQKDQQAHDQQMAQAADLQASQSQAADQAHQATMAQQPQSGESQ